MAARKKWSEHSVRWQRTARREGLSQRLWDRWLRLSARTRRRTNQRSYAAGKTVRTQILAPRRSEAVKKLAQAHGGGARLITIERGVKLMTAADLNRVMRMTIGQLGIYAARRAAEPVPAGYMNPWWYR